MRLKWNRIFLIVCIGIFILVYIQKSVTNRMLPEVVMQPITKGALTESVSIQTRIRSKTHRLRCLSDVIFEDVYVRADTFVYAGEAIASVYPLYIDNMLKTETDAESLAWLREIAENGYVLCMPEDGYVTEVNIDRDSRREKYDILLMYERMSDPEIYLEFPYRKDSLIQTGDTVSLQVENDTDANTAVFVIPAKLVQCEMQENTAVYTCVPQEINKKTLHSGMHAALNIRKQTEPYDVIVPLSALTPIENKKGWFSVMFAVPLEEKNNSGRYTAVKAEVKLLRQTDTMAGIQYVCGDNWCVITESKKTVRHLDTVRRAGVW